jgi:hypothetical protein
MPAVTAADLRRAPDLCHGVCITAWEQLGPLLTMSRGRWSRNWQPHPAADRVPSVHELELPEGVGEDPQDRCVRCVRRRGSRQGAESCACHSFCCVVGRDADAVALGSAS